MSNIILSFKELNKLKDTIYATEVAHGFHDEKHTVDHELGMVLSEIGEAIDADRNPNAPMPTQKTIDEAMELVDESDEQHVAFIAYFKEHIKGSVEDELADIVIRLLDFAGIKGYTPYVGTKAQRTLDSTDAFLKFEEGGMPGMLFHLMDFLAAGFDWDSLWTCIYNIIYILEDCFDKITGGSDCDLWWFVEKKMRYNELRPMLNGKKY